MNRLWNKVQASSNSLFNQIQAKNNGFEDYVELSGVSREANTEENLTNTIDSLLQSAGSNIAILGDYGMGKSYFLEYWYFKTLTLGFQSAKGLLPVFLSLRDFDGDKFGLDWVLTQTNDQLGLSLTLSELDLHWKQERELVLILDGIDETPNVASPVNRNRLLNQLSLFAREKGPLIVSARRSFFPARHLEEIALEDFSRIHIQPLKADQVKVIVASFFKDQEVNVQGFLDMLQSDKSLLELASRPIFLEFLLRVYRSDPNVVVKNSADLYKRIIESSLSKELIKKESNLSVDALSSFMEELAWQQFLNGTYATNRNVLKTIIEQWTARTGHRGINEDIRGVLTRLDGDKFAFLHASIREFFVAQKLANEIIAKSPQSFSKRALREEIFAFILQILENNEHLNRLKEVFLNPDLNPIGRANMIPLLRRAKIRGIHAVLKNALLNDENALIRFMSGYSLIPAVFAFAQSEPPKDFYDDLILGYRKESNALVRAQFARLLEILSPESENYYPELELRFFFDKDYIADIMVHDEDIRLDMACERIIALGNERVEVVLEPMRILTLYTVYFNQTEAPRILELIKSFAEGPYGQEAKSLVDWSMGLLQEPDKIKKLQKVKGAGKDGRTISKNAAFRRSEKEAWEKRLEEVLEHNFMDASFSMQDFAREMGLGSDSTLRRKFKSLIDKEASPRNYLLQYRLAKAAEFLDKGATSISNLAAEVGFNDHSYFTRIFREEFGSSPSEYQNSRR